MNSLRSKVVSVALSLATVAALVPMAAQAAAHSVGTNVNASGTIWMVRDNGSGGMCRAAYTSAGAFLSYGFNSWAGVVDANADDLALAVCAQNFIPPQDGSIITSDRDDNVAVKGTTYIISAGKKIGVTDPVTFAALGYKFSNGTVGDVSWMQSGGTLSSGTQQHPVGTIVMNGGTAQYVGATSLLGFPSLDVFNSWGYSFAKTVPSNVADRLLPQAGIVQPRQPGQLSPEIGSVVLPPSGSVTVSTSVNTPAAATVPQSATSVKLLSFNVNNATSSSVSINQVTVHRSGAGATSDFDNIYLYQGSSRLTSGRSINASTNDSVFSSLSISAPANGSVTLDVLGDVNASAGAGNVHAFSVNSVMLSAGTASGSATGNTMTIAGVDAGTITIAKSGSFSNPKVGQQNIKVAEFQLSANSTEDLSVRRVSLFQGGNISRSNLTNFKLMQSGVQVATAAGIDSKDHVVFDGLNFKLEKGNSRVFEVFADIAGSAKSGDTIKFYLEESTDLLAIGNTYGFGAAVTRTGYDGDSCTTTAGDCSYSSIEAGQLTIAFNGPAGKDIARDAKDVELMTFSMTAQSNLEVRQFGLDFDGGTGTADFTNGSGTQLFTDVKIWDTGSNTVVWGPLDMNDASATSETMTFTEDVTLTAGQTRNFKVTLDVANDTDVTDGETIRATIDIDDITSSQVKNLDNNTFLASTDIVPGSDINGNTHTLRAQSLTVTLASVPQSQTYIKGTTDRAFVGFNFAAGTGSDVKVNSVKVTCYIDDSNVQTDFVKGQDTDAGGGTTDCLETVPTIRLKVDGVQIGDAKSPADGTDGTATFSNLSYTIAKGTSKVFTVYGDISSSAYRNSNVERIAFDIVTAADDISSVDPNGNSITETGDAVNGGTSPSRIITIDTAGTLTAALAATTIDVNDSRIVPVGREHVMTQVKFTAANEELKLTKARIKIVSADADVDTSDNVASVSLYNGSTLVAGPVVPSTPSSCTDDSTSTDACADFNIFSTDFIIPKDGSATLTAKATLSTMSAGADSGDEFSLDLDQGENFEARGTSGSTQITSITADIAGNDVVVRKSQPKVELVALNSTVLTNGTLPVLKFKITAVDGDVAIKHIDFSTEVSDNAGITLSAPAVREAGTGSDITATVAITDGATTPSNVTFSSEQQITSGGSKTYEFRVNVAGAGSADTLATQITGDTATVTGELSTSAADQTIDDIDDLINVGNDSGADAAYNFIWSDMSGSLDSSGVYSPAHNDTSDDGTGTTDTTTASNDWTNGRYIRVVPTDTQTLTFPS